MHFEYEGYEVRRVADPCDRCSRAATELNRNNSPRPIRRVLLYGVAAIAAYLDMPEEATRHLIRKGVIPTFRIGRTVCARPDRIDAALDQLERQQEMTDA